jgi:hypothetical protein
MGFLSRLFGSSSKGDAAVPPPRITDAEAKTDGEKLLESLLPFAEHLLQQHREFFPFGGRMAPDGTITHEGAYTGTEHPPSQQLIDLLRQAHRKDASSQKIRACATIYDIRTVPPGRTEKQDAIAAAIDHVSGYSAVVIFPYVFDALQTLRFESPFAVEGAHDIFASPQKFSP